MLSIHPIYIKYRVTCEKIKERKKHSLIFSSAHDSIAFSVICRNRLIFLFKKVKRIRETKKERNTAIEN